jgi:hypothetical protein
MSMTQTLANTYRSADVQILAFLAFRRQQGTSRFCNLTGTRRTRMLPKGYTQEPGAPDPAIRTQLFSRLRG